MSEQDGPRKKVKAEHVSAIAVAVALLGGGTSVGLQTSSNNRVIEKLDAVNISMVEMKAQLKANDADKARLEQTARETKDGFERLRNEIVDIKQRLILLENKPR